MTDFGWSNVAGKGTAAQNAWFVEMYNLLFRGRNNERPALGLANVVTAITMAVRQIANSGPRPVAHDAIVDTLVLPSKANASSTELYMFARHLAKWLQTYDPKHVDHIYVAAELLTTGVDPRGSVRLLSFQGTAEHQVNVMDFFRKK